MCPRKTASCSTPHEAPTFPQERHHRGIALHLRPDIHGRSCRSFRWIDTSVVHIRQLHTVKKLFAMPGLAQPTKNVCSVRSPTGLTQDLNLSTLPTNDHLSELLRVVDALGPGQSVAVVGVRNCGQVLRYLQAERPAACDRSAGSDSARGIRLALRRRVDARTVTEYFEADHHRLDTLLNEAISKLRAGSLLAAREVYHRFAEGIRRHMLAEETILFPLVERAYGFAVGAKTVVGAEHGTIRELLDRLGTLLLSEQPEGCVGVVLELLEVLARHDMKEERVLYPMVDRQLDDQRRVELVARVAEL